MKIKGFLFLMVLSQSSVFGQYKAEEFQAALLQAKYGAYLVYNGQKNSFTLQFISNSVEPTEKPNFVIVDNLIVQASIVPFNQSWDFENLDVETQKTLLVGWKKYEKEWVEEQLKVKLKEREEITKIDGRIFLYWSFDMPKDRSPDTVIKQVYLVTICFDQILTINGPVDKKTSESLVREKLTSIARTLQLHTGEVQDLKKLYDDLMK